MQKQPPSCEKWLCVRRWLLSNRDCMTIDSRAFHRSPHRRRRVGAHRCRVVGSPHGRRVVGTGTATTQTIPLHGLVLESPLAFDGDGHHGVAVATTIAAVVVATSAANFRTDTKERSATTFVCPAGGARRDLRLVGVAESISHDVGPQHFMDHHLVLHIHLGRGTAPTEDGDQTRQNETDKRLDFHEQFSFPAINTSTFYTQCQA